MRKSSIAAFIPAILLGSAVFAQAPQPEQPSPAAPAAQQSQPPAPTDAASGTAVGETEVGTPASNVDEKSSSGSYYPYSAGTAGDDPAEPRTTSLPPQDGIEPGTLLNERWVASDTDGDKALSKAEFERAWPTLGSRFTEIDVNADKKLTPDELRAWHLSQKTRMDADQAATPPASDEGGLDAATPSNMPSATTAPTSDAPPTGTPDTSDY